MPGALVIHGTDDQVLPIRHTQAIARGIAGSDLQLIDGMGHLPTRSEWNRIAQLVVAHIAGS